jgi:MOSC domain-containing protein YiiM
VSSSSAVVAIHIGEEESGPLRSVDSVRAVAGRGLEGDRNFHTNGAASGKALTLVEEESVEDAGLEAGATRRQITVRGIRLSGLVGKRFTVGDVECYAVKLCEPCKHLESMTRPGLVKDLLHRAGINADILGDGTISVGDDVRVVEDARSAVADPA